MFIDETVELYLTLYAFILTMHFICEFVLVWAYQYENGHIYGHPGGLIHTLIHATGLFTVLGFILGGSNFIAILVLLVSIVHYHLTWITLKALKGAKESKCFRRLFDAQWWVIGFDQWAHHMVYCGILLAIHTRENIAGFFLCESWPFYINQIGLILLR